MPDKKYTLKDSGRPPEPVAPEVPLEDRIELQAKRIYAIEKRIAHHEREAEKYEAEYARLMAEYADGFRDRARKLKIELDASEMGMVYLIEQLPEKNRNFRFARTTYSLSGARTSVDIIDNAEAVKELEALGPAGSECVRIKKEVDKKKVLEFMERGDAPGLEYIRKKIGETTLARRRS